MANDIYKGGIQRLISGSIDLDTDTMKFAIVRSYTPNVSSHVFVSDVTGAGATIVARSAALSGISVASGIFDATDVTFTSVAAGAACAHLILYKDTGADATSPLLAVFDTATGLPVTPDGGNISLTFDNGANKIINFDT